MNRLAYTPHATSITKRQICKTESLNIT